MPKGKTAPPEKIRGRVFTFLFVRNDLLHKMQILLGTSKDRQRGEGGEERGKEGGRRSSISYSLSFRCLLMPP